MIPVFDGCEYQCWKKRILKFMEYKKCKDAATREKTATDKEENWSNKDAKAMKYIYSSITNKQLKYVEDLDSAYKILNKFDELYKKKNQPHCKLCVGTI